MQLVIQMDKFCEQFKGGYCKRVDMHVPRDWCVDVCKGNWNGRDVNTSKTMLDVPVPLAKEPPPPYKELSLLEMGENFTRAMGRAAKYKFKKIDEHKFIERQVCCTICGGNVGRCPFCGCKLKWKSWLKSERSCPSHENYPNLRKYPHRDYWSVCDEMTTAIIPARNEPHLSRTVAGLLENATGALEVIVVLDGFCITDIVDDERVRVIRCAEPVGRRVAINRVASRAKGKYLFMIDAHCTMSPGWDTQLKCACEEKTIVASQIRSLDENWGPRPDGYYTFVRLDRDMQIKWWGGYKPKANEHRVIKETMAFSGCGWMIQKDYYEQLGGFDESLGEYDHTGAEWSLKVWLHAEHAGRVVIRTDVICGHVFGTNEGRQNYKPKVINQQGFHNRMAEKYGGRLQRLVDKFTPVPGWDSKPAFVTIIKCVDGSAPRGVMNYCAEQLAKAAANNKIITEAKPAGSRRSHRTLYEQMLKALQFADADFVFIAEQDVLYHPSRFRFVPPRDDTFYYQANFWRLDDKGYFKFGNRLLSMLVCNRELLIRNITERIEALKSGWKLKWSEPGVGDPNDNGWKVDYYSASHPSVDIRHGRNFTGGQKAAEYIESVPYWGDYRKLWEKLRVGEQSDGDG